MEAMTVFPKDKEQFNAVAAIMKALKIPFEKTKKESSPVAKNLPQEESSYDPEFVKKILQGDKDLQEGKRTAITLEELKELCK